MSGAGIFGTATSGLLAFQRALSTTGHNIANVNTPGYSRQRVEIVTQTPQASGAGFIGTGVKTTTVERLYDQFLTERVRSSTSSTSNLEIFRQYAGRIADVLGDPDAGLNGALENFFNAVQGVSNDPTSGPARQLLLSESESLVTRFQYLDRQMTDTRQEVNAQLGTLVDEVNSLSRAIADINKEIVVAVGRSGGQPPNDLLDTRDQLVGQLSELVAVKTLPQDDGALNVFIGNGQSLVTGYNAATLSVSGSAYDATEMRIYYGTGPSAADITDNVRGGKLGGLQQFREDILDPAQNDLGRIAVVLGTEFNLQHRLGMDLDGELGGDFFSLAEPQVNGHRSNSVPGGTVDVDFDSANIGALTGEDYVLSFDGTNWNLADLEGNAVSLSGAGTLASPFKAVGLDIVVGGSPSTGDRFMIRPTRDGGEDIGMAINGVRDIAAAAPARISEATSGSGLPTNTGDANLRYSGVDSGFALLSSDITFTYDSFTNTFSYSDGTITGTLSPTYDPATDSGSSYAFAGVNFVITGVPANGDSFVLRNNINGSGDNANALRLAGLQTALTVDNGSASFQGSYAQLVADIGSQTRRADISATAQQGLLRQAVQDRDALSGVNLDEEAANMMRFQQAYQAIAQVITTADTMFQTLLGALRR